MPQRRESSEGDGALFVLTVVGGPDVGKELRLHGAQPTRALVGLSEACDLRLTDSLVSRRHAAFEIVHGRLHLSDLATPSGTLVEGVCVGDAYLRGGETVRLGATAMHVSRQARKAEAPLPAATSFGRLIGASAEMRRLYPLCEKLATATVPVIIEGETGTGKEVLAESLHERGPLSSKPFVVFD